MKCNHCGTEFEAKFCPECGARADFGSSQPEQQVLQSACQTEVKREKKKKPLILIILILVAFIGISVALGGRDGDKTDNDSDTTTEATTEKVSETVPADAETPEALEVIIMADIESEIAALNAEYADLISSVTTYDKYVKKASDIEAFYEKIADTSYGLTVKMCEYSIAYAELLVNSGKSADDIYDELDGLYDCLYDNASDEIYDGIYNGILDDMYDDLYSGVIEEGIDSTSYGEWSDVSSAAYRMWSDSSTECYRHWSDMSSDIYRFWSDLSGDMFSGKIEDAENTIEEFKADVRKMKGDSTVSAELTTEKSQTTGTTEAVTETTTQSTTKSTTQPTTTEKDASADGMRPEFKEAMDSYETFMTDYVDFMKKFEENPSDLSILADYADYMSKYTDFVDDFEAWDDEDMNNAEMAYYIDVQARVSKKLLEVS